MLELSLWFYWLFIVYTIGVLRRDREVVVVLQEQLEGEALDELESLYLVKVEPRGRRARFQTPPPFLPVMKYSVCSADSSPYTLR